MIATLFRLPLHDAGVSKETAATRIEFTAQITKPTLLRPLRMSLPGIPPIVALGSHPAVAHTVM